MLEARSTRSRSREKAIVIGGRVWSTRNLEVTTFCNGDRIPQARRDADWRRAAHEARPAFCYPDNDPVLGRRYGALYNWYAVGDKRGLAPPGWHVATDDEWEALVVHVGGAGEAGTALKSKRGWKSASAIAGGDLPGCGTDLIGFAALPAGYRFSGGSFVDRFDDLNRGLFGDWWTATEQRDDVAYHRHMASMTSAVTRGLDIKGGGCSVRCVREDDATASVVKARKPMQ